VTKKISSLSYIPLKDFYLFPQELLVKMSSLTTIAPTTMAALETSSLPSPPLDCPNYGDYGEQLVEASNFWVQGVLQTMIAVPGLLGEKVKNLM